MENISWRRHASLFVLPDGIQGDKTKTKQGKKEDNLTYVYRFMQKIYVILIRQASYKNLYSVHPHALIRSGLDVELDEVEAPVDEVREGEVEQRR